MTELKRYPIDEAELRVIVELKQFVETKLDRLAEETIFWNEERIKLCQREEQCK
jgi:predicted RecB family nuclease